MNSKKGKNKEKFPGEAIIITALLIGIALIYVLESNGYEVLNTIQYAFEMM